MKKLVAILVASLFVASAASAVVDPDMDMMGFYFDQDADVVCSPAGGETIVNIFWTNPSKDFMQGLECGFYFEGAGYYFLGKEYISDQKTDVGTAQNFICGYGAPVPTTPATLLGGIKILVMSTDPIYIYMTDADPSSFPGTGLPGVVYPEDGVLKKMTCGLSALEGPSAQINGAECVVIPSEDDSFGNVKSLFR